MSIDAYMFREDLEKNTSENEFRALQTVIGALQPMDHAVRKRILQSAETFYGVETPPRHPGSSVARAVETTQSATSGSRYSEDTSMSPKDFLLEKQPKTDVERIACLAYYLTHYRSMPHFKTIDLSILNTEAAQPEFANAAYSSNN